MKKLIYIVLMFVLILSCEGDKKKDKTPPGIAVLTLEESSSKIQLNWTLPDDNDIDEIHIMRGLFLSNLVKLDSIKLDELFSYSDESAEENQTYYYKIYLVDKAGNVGELSNDVRGKKIDINPILTFHEFNQTAVVKKSNVNIDIIDHFIFDKSTDNISYTTIDDDVVTGLSKLYAENLTNGVKYYLRVRAVDLDGYVSNGSVVEVTPFNRVETAWDDILEGNYAEAISSLTLNVSNIANVTISKNARAWAYLLNSGGDTSSELIKAVTDFISDHNASDSKAGLVLAYYYQENYTLVLDRVSEISALDSYSHLKLTHITQNILRLYGAYSAWYSFDYSTSESLLDLVEPGVDHNGGDAALLLGHIDRLFDDSPSKNANYLFRRGKN